MPTSPLYVFGLTWAYTVLVPFICVATLQCLSALFPCHLLPLALILSNLFKTQISPECSKNKSAQAIHILF